MKMHSRLLSLLGAATLALALSFPVTAAETITLTDDGGATPESDDALLQDTFTRSQDDQRGRHADKLYVFRDIEGSNNYAVAYIRFNNLTERIGEGRNILRAKLVLEATNAGGPKPIEVVAYPLLEDWDYSRLQWSLRMFDGKQRLWNAPPNSSFNPTPAPSTAADVSVFDIAERHDETPVLAYAHRPGSDNQSVAESMDAEFDVTKLVRLWYEGSLQNYGWALIAPGSTDYVRFWASNGEGNGPRLIIDLE